MGETRHSALRADQRCRRKRTNREEEGGGTQEEEEAPLFLSALLPQTQSLSKVENKKGSATRPRSAIEQRETHAPGGTSAPFVRERKTRAQGAGGKGKNKASKQRVRNR